MKNIMDKKNTEKTEWTLLDTSSLNIYRKIYIYGAGMVAKNIYKYLCKQPLRNRIEAFLVTDITKKQEDILFDKRIWALDDVSVSDEDVVILAATLCNRQQMREECQKRSIRNILEISTFDKKDEKFYATLPESAYPAELKEWYFKITGEILDLKHPKTFNEKIQWMKLYDRDSRRTDLSDKYFARKYVEKKIGKKYLVPLLGVWNRFDDIDFEQLPEQFVLKCNHGCGWNYIVKERSKLDIADAKEKIDNWMHRNYAFVNGFELQYQNIQPRIIAEKYLENHDDDLWDYKFWCFDGKVDFIMLLTNRQYGLCMNNYDRNWNLLPFTYNYPNSERCFQKPDNLKEMIELAESLSEGFPHVRIDLYRLNDGSIKFGEFTFTSASGVCKWSDAKINSRLGRLFEIYGQ